MQNIDIPIRTIPSKTFSFLSLLTLSLIYAKLESDFIIHWIFVLSPLLGYYLFYVIEQLI